MRKRKSLLNSNGQPAHWVRPHGPDPRVQRITTTLLRRDLAAKPPRPG
ncbi:MAG: hypothetical protein AAB225_11505 [Acidobacteriota bacterium]